MVGGVNPDPIPMNCLEGLQCPDCGNRRKFNIGVNAWAVVKDDGIQSMSEADWEMDSWINCPYCAESGRVSDFSINLPDDIVHHIIQESA